MARPSIKAERTEEILQAYERCIALYGVEGATLQKIAEEAQIARPLLRHHVGNSEDLQNKALTRFIERNTQEMYDFYEQLPVDCDGKRFVDFLFYDDPETDEVCSDVMIAAAFIHAAQTNAETREKMQTWLKEFTDAFVKQMCLFYPNAPMDMVENVSAGIIGIYFNVDALAPLGDLKTLRAQSLQAALYLLTALEE